MLKILVPIDGSECALRALNDAIGLAKESSGGAEIHLLNVQVPIVSGHAKMFLSKETIDAYYKAESDEALAAAVAAAQASGIAFHAGMRNGQFGETIANYAKEKQCDRIVMGTRGLGAVGGLVLGSVAQKVIHLSPVPVTLVK
ncbi:universal stress protein [Bordetella hinzii]|jgi:nucleotide-binding universal stress UspA family protein|uniref:Universal stress protein n=2 Tax=Bordetella hinzii TaxID=103855 RepID=A0AAN1VHE9_9BORD|nr:universal stress protein [Bordetella hinzii]AKQ55877.1 Universal stress protein family protein [Bordetella hinzii]AKQ60409.1 Universal stress protein family protein [Bordetella hinzii]AZW18538.1 universal stress protein [Bordetella hinzii]KCB25622.1 universal stress family protein [Bordetella hinzii OH87 BAL007II]KCB28019.1 universal stress family protein [Bordetella hinzii CA90 BAL1384]